jgi:hypothetical protein
MKRPQTAARKTGLRPGTTRSRRSTPTASTTAWNGEDTTGQAIVIGGPIVRLSRFRGCLRARTADKAQNQLGSNRLKCFELEQLG